MTTIAVRIALILVILLLIAERVQAQDAITAARDLYASAQYDEALKVLDTLASDTSSSAADKQSIELYRTLCLLAVGRRDDAERAIEAIIARDPLYRAGDDLPPRTRAVFGETKRRLLPTIVQQQYADAKTAFERKDFEPAAAGFKRVLDALNDPEIYAAAKLPPLSDLRTLAVGFLDLSVKSIPPAAPPPAPAPVVPVNLPPKVFTGDEPGVRMPVAIAQELPRYPGVVPPTGFTGVVEVLINEKGVVDSAAMVVPVTNYYDKLVLTAATKWLFHPATLEGTPIKFRKRIQINIAPPVSKAPKR
jgi:tetratricopeptide (TPR) repeat protein